MHNFQIREKEGRELINTKEGKKRRIKKIEKENYTENIKLNGSYKSKYISNQITDKLIKLHS